jgi:hypothetical protein
MMSGTPVGSSAWKGGAGRKKNDDSIEAVEVPLNKKQTGLAKKGDHDVENTVNHVEAFDME